MLRNYLLIAYRTLKRRKGYAFINVFGLAVGLACCILIAMYVQSELSYDDFHEHADRLVAVAGGSFGLATPYPLADALESELPSVERAVRMMWPGSGEVSRDGQSFTEEDGVFHAGADFFELFSFPFVRGTPRGALSAPNTAIISEELAAKYFPDDNPVGQTLTIDDRGQHTYRITGVARSRGDSYLDFNAVLSFSTLDYAATHADAWGASMFVTFALLTDGTRIATFNEQAEALVKRHRGEDTKTRFSAQPLSGLYLSDLVTRDGFRGKWRYIYLFGAVAIFILLIACVNYVNLATARATQRAQEVGVRKSIGASRGQVARQFIGESILLSAGAFILGVLFAKVALPGFNELFGTQLTFGDAGPPFFLLLAGATGGVGLLAGCYPALYLSAFEPTRVLKGHTDRGRSGAWLRKGLVVVQFSIAVALLVGTAVVYEQLHFTQQKDLGFDGEQVVLVDAPSEGRDAFKHEVASHLGITSASLTSAVPGRFRLTLALRPNEITSESTIDSSKVFRFLPTVVDFSYLETLKIDVIAGRGFSRDHASDVERAYVLNETAVEQLGWTAKEAVGKPLLLSADARVVGVVEDFHTTSLHSEIQPVVMHMQNFESGWSPTMLAVRLSPSAIQEGLRHIEQQHKRFSDEPFEYSFLDNEFDEMYRTEQRLGQVFGGFAGIAILLSCLGLFGLSAYMAERRTKEIGIRKVLGANITSIVALLSGDFLKLVLIAFIIAAPAAYFLMQKWLEDFAYRIELGPWLFVGAGGLAVLIALATVSFQAVRAALTDPVVALRTE